MKYREWSRGSEDRRASQGDDGRSQEVTKNRDCMWAAAGGVLAAAALLGWRLYRGAVSSKTGMQVRQESAAAAGGGGPDLDTPQLTFILFNSRSGGKQVRILIFNQRAFEFRPLSRTCYFSLWSLGHSGLSSHSLPSALLALLASWNSFRLIYSFHVISFESWPLRVLLARIPNDFRRVCRPPPLLCLSLVCLPA